MAEYVSAILRASFAPHILTQLIVNVFHDAGFSWPTHLFHLAQGSHEPQPLATPAASWEPLATAAAPWEPLATAAVPWEPLATAWAAVLDDRKSRTEWERDREREREGDRDI